MFVASNTIKKVKMAFIPQHDNYYEVLTVRECLIFSSKLHNSTQRKALGKDYIDSVVTSAEPPENNARSRRRMTISHRNFHSMIADNIMTMLGLEKAADVTAGAISGGQQKRLSIAQELVSKPNILMLDEPTSKLQWQCV